MSEQQPGPSQADAESLAAKLKTFAEGLEPGEQDVLATVLESASQGPEVEGHTAASPSVPIPSLFSVESILGKKQPQSLTSARGTGLPMSPGVRG